MKIEVREEPKKIVYFWMSRSEAADTAQMNRLTPQFKAWKSKGYLPIVFESGNGKLEDGMYMLMKKNYEELAKKEIPAAPATRS